MRLLLTLALACRRRERDRGRLVAVELHGQLRRHDVPARSWCGRFALARARSRPRDVVVRCRPLPICKRRRMRRAALLRHGRLHRLRHGGACRQRDAARGDRQLGVPVEDHARVRLRAYRRSRRCSRRPTPFQRPARYFASHARCSQGHHRLPRPSRQRAADDLRADRAHGAVRPLRAAWLAADAAHASLCERGRLMFGAAACLAVRDQGLGQERLHRPDPREHHGAHQTGLAVPRAAARAVSRPTRACRTGTLRRRGLSENRFSGSVPPAISALTVLTLMCVPFARPGSPPTRRMRRCASAGAARGRFIFGAAAWFAVRDQVLGHERLHRPDPREHHGAHPAGPPVRRAAARAVSRPTRACWMGTLRHRSLFENRFSGSVPPTVSALTALTRLCARTAALPRGLDEWLSKRAQEPLRCRQLFGNRLEGRVPPSLLAMRIPNLLYAPLPVSAREPASPRASGRRCSLFPQEGCPLARYGREGQDKDASDFGVCVAGPVRPLVAVPLGPSLPHAHKAPAHKPTLAHRRETDGEIRITDACPNAVAPAMSAAASGTNGPFFRLACRIINGHVPYP